MDGMGYDWMPSGNFFVHFFPPVFSTRGGLLPGVRVLESSLAADPGVVATQIYTLQETNISPQKWHFEDDFPFPKVGYVNPLEGMFYVHPENWGRWTHFEFLYK